MNRLLMGCSLILMTACSGGEAEKTSSANQGQQAKSENASQTTSPSNTSRGVMKRLELNDGKPWKADEEMIERVAAMEGVLAENGAVEKIDQVSLAEALDHHTGKLIASCTMKGQGHEELHKWLEPYMALIKDLHNAKSDDEAKEIAGELQTMLNVFGEYFE